MPAIRVKLTGPARRLLSKGRGKAAVRRSSKKAAATSARDMRSEAVKQVRETKRLKVRAIRKAVVLRRNKGRKISDMEWGVDIRGDKARLGDYPARQTKKGVSVEINRGKRVLIRGAFITKVGGHRGVFKRQGFSRLPIKELVATRPFDVLKQRRAARAVTTRGRKSFKSTYMRVLKMEMEKAAR